MISIPPAFGPNFVVNKIDVKNREVLISSKSRTLIGTVDSVKVPFGGYMGLFVVPFHKFWSKDMKRNLKEARILEKKSSDLLYFWYGVNSAQELENLYIASTIAELEDKKSQRW
jgi:hypothetical protein